jgi:lipopolysaccharide export system protein LptA
MVLLAGALLVAALGVFLCVGKWKSLIARRDLPHRLGIDIQQEANGYTFVHAFGAHSRYRIHASKEITLKNDRVELHDVEIDLYGEDGASTERIAGDEFEFDQKSGVATAQGPVEMLLTRPPSPSKPGPKGKTPAEASAGPGAAGQIDVKTSGVTFDRNTGLVTTDQRVQFSMNQGTGSAMGAKYDSQSGYLTLQQQVELKTVRGGDEVLVHAQHAEFDRGAQTCWLRATTAAYRGRQADAGQARILFRLDGSAEHMDAVEGFTLTTMTGGRLTAPTAAMDFDEDSHPRRGQLGGGVTMDSAREGRIMHGTSPTAELEFTSDGQLRQAHLERGVTMESDETRQEASGAGSHVQRTWRSPAADIDFRQTNGKSRGETEPDTIHGTGGVVITSQSRRGDAAVVPAKIMADEVTGTFGPGSVLRSMTGVGHAGIEQTTATGTRQTASGDRLAAQFSDQGSKGTREQDTAEQGDGANGVESAELDGHVALFEQPAAKPGAQPHPPLRATAGKASYEGAGDWLHLTMNPRLTNGGMELTAEKVDVSQASGDAIAHGNVKATWSGEGTADGGQSGAASPAEGGATLGGKGPAHVIAADAQLNESTREATFRGHARLWQEANSVTAPVIVLNQHLQTLVARTTDPAEPVRVVLLSAGAPGAGNAASHGANQSASRPGSAGNKAATPSVIRVRGSDLWYSDAERRAVMRSGVAGAVVAETGTAISTSDAAELRLMPAGNRDAGAAGQAQVDRMTASGNVVLTSQERRGTGTQLVYSSVTGDYALTGTATAPPKMTDPMQGSVTGEVLIFHSADDSVSIEGGGQETRTETTAPPARPKQRQN